EHTDQKIKKKNVSQKHVDHHDDRVNVLSSSVGTVTKSRAVLLIRLDFQDIIGQIKFPKHCEEEVANNYEAIMSMLFKTDRPSGFEDNGYREEAEHHPENADYRHVWQHVSFGHGDDHHQFWTDISRDHKEVKCEGAGKDSMRGRDVI
uniref:C2 tensin-type domain-containing protein n=1 Tax=Rodentolepis nana TaxID=102285 RepID=A0A0R3TCA3_RODNA